ncbi:MAG: hypothetical protein GY779_04410 [Gammaproteobacteria bacterium]|nr:hypothetical protein [Gammaproteobacteria bacterium]
MPQLSDGQRVSITWNRSLQRVAQNGCRITEHTPLTALYPLIDIIMPEDGESIGPDDRSVYLGKTLADWDWIGRWSDEDQKTFWTWVSSDPVQAALGKVRDRLVKFRDVLSRYTDVDVGLDLYSPINSWLDVASQDRATGSQWLGMFRNAIGHGISRDEIYASYLGGWLTQRNDQVIDRSEVESYLCSRQQKPVLAQLVNGDNRPRINFESCAKLLSRPTDDLFQDSEYELIRYRDRSYGFSIVQKRSRLSGPGCYSWIKWRLVDERGCSVPGKKGSIYFDSPKQVMAHADEYLQERGIKLRSASHGVVKKYEHESIPGGEGYQEWLVLLPDLWDDYYSSHFHIRNLLVHMRTKIRSDLIGRRFLYIEEIQSDWHQGLKRRQKTFAKKQGKAPFRKEWHGLALKYLIDRALVAGVDGIAWSGADEQTLISSAISESTFLLYEKKIAEYLEKLCKPWNMKVATTDIPMRHKWLHATKVEQYWKVMDIHGKFETKARFTYPQALQIIDRHSKRETRQVKCMILPEEFRNDIKQCGFPLFGINHCQHLDYCQEKRYSSD